MQVQIRPITSTDTVAIASIHAESWRSAYRGILRDEYLDRDLVGNRVALWTRRLSPLPPRHFGYIALADEAPVGFSFAFGANDERWGTHIDNLHVVPKHKGAGLGRALLATIARHANEHYADAGVFLWVYEQNLPARGFYERVGATCVERVDIAAPDGAMISECRYVWSSPMQLFDRCRLP